MLEMIPSNQFKRDLKLAKKRGCKIENLRNVMLSRIGFLFIESTKMHLNYIYSVPEHIRIYFNRPHRTS